MALKTFNVDEKAYGEYSRYCRGKGISMSKRVEKFIQAELDRIKGKNKSLDSSRISQVSQSQSQSEQEHSFKKYC